MTTLHDFGGVLGRPLDTFFRAFTTSWSQLLTRVWSGPWYKWWMIPEGINNKRWRRMFPRILDTQWLPWTENHIQYIERFHDAPSPSCARLTVWTRTPSCTAAWLSIECGELMEHDPVKAKPLEGAKLEGAHFPYKLPPLTWPAGRERCGPSKLACGLPRPPTTWNFLYDSSHEIAGDYVEK